MWRHASHLDETLETMKTSSELRDASRQMGRQTLRVANHLLLRPAVDRVWTVLWTADKTPGHHPVVFGMMGAAMQWRSAEMGSAYLYSTSAALVGAALSDLCRSGSSQDSKFSRI